jgi:hypothetical protein
VVRVLVTATRDPHTIQLERRAIGRSQIRVKGLTHRMHLQPCFGRKGPSFCAANEFLSTGKSHDDINKKNYDRARPHISKLSVKKAAGQGGIAARVPEAFWLALLVKLRAGALLGRDSGSLLSQLKNIASSQCWAS